MTQQILHSTQIGSSFEEVCGEAVTEGVGKRRNPFVDHPPNASRSQRPATHTDPQSISCIIACEGRPGVTEIPIDRLLGRFTYGNAPPLVALPDNRQ